MSNCEVLKPGLSIRPEITLDECKTLVQNLYGLKCSEISELVGYDDKNYKVIARADYKNENIICINEDGYVLKILNSLDSRKVSFIEAQNQLLLYLGNSNANIKCPIPVPTITANYYSVEKLISGKHIVRLMIFVPGIILYKVPTSPNLFYELGKYIANLDNVLKKFSHDAYTTHKTLWMLEQVPEIRKFTFAIQNIHRRQMIEDIIQQFEDRVLVYINNLEKGILHGDFNEQNILVKCINDIWNVDAVLDFGDSQYSCFVFELAITMTYMMILAKDLDAGGYVIAGYSTVRSIPEEEFLLLKVCVEARLCQSLVMGTYSNMQDPNNDYVLVTVKPGWELFDKLRSISEDVVLKRWKRVSSEYSKQIREL